MLYGCFRYRADALFELTDALGEDAPRAGGHAAEELARSDPEHDIRPTQRQIGYRPLVARMYPAGGLLAERARRRRWCRHGGDDNLAVRGGNTLELKIFETRQNFGEHDFLGKGKATTGTAGSSSFYDLPPAHPAHQLRGRAPMIWLSLAGWLQVRPPATTAARALERQGH
jgi:hypothetical protein